MKKKNKQKVLFLNDVYTYISYGDENKDWDLFTAEIANEEYHKGTPQDGTAINKLMASLFPEHKGNYYDWDWNESGDVLDTKWCHIHQVDDRIALQNTKGFW